MIPLCIKALPIVLVLVVAIVGYILLYRGNQDYRNDPAAED